MSQHTSLDPEKERSDMLKKVQEALEKELNGRNWDLIPKEAMIGLAQMPMTTAADVREWGVASLMEIRKLQK